MNAQAYVELRERLDGEPLGLPATGSGLELRLLETLFTPEEASVYLQLATTLEEPSTLLSRLGGSLEHVGGVLDAMVRKGLVRRSTKARSVRYAALPFVLGALEFQLRSKDPGFGSLFDRFFEEAYGESGVSIGKPVRVMPVTGSVDGSCSASPSERARALVAAQGTLAVSPCICRAQQRLLEKGCDQPLEACLQFGRRARQVVEDGTGRFVASEEALDLLASCERAGLVCLAFLGEGGGGLCNCCGDCCLLLRWISLDPAPARRVSTEQRAEVDRDACSGCGACLGRCQVDALTFRGVEVAEVDRDRCIGCGLCVTTCPTGALSLRKRPVSEGAETVTGGDHLLQLVRQELRDFVREAGAVVS